MGSPQYLGGATSSGDVPPPFQGGSGASDVVVQLRGIVAQLSAWVQKFTNRAVFGTFTLAAAATTTVTQPGVQSTSVIHLTPTNAAAAALMGSAKSLYISALTPGASFAVATANATAAVGTETFSYVILTPS
jgi:hypothetical protein